MSSTNDYFSYTAVDDAGVKTFSLRGGAYAVTLASDAWGTVALEILSANGETFVPFVTWSSNTAQVMNLPAGHYQFAYSGLDTAALSIVQQPTPGWPMPTNLPSAISSGGGITTYGPVGTPVWAYTRFRVTLARASRRNDWKPSTRCPTS